MPALETVGGSITSGPTLLGLCKYASGEEGKEGERFRRSLLLTSGGGLAAPVTKATPTGVWVLMVAVDSPRATPTATVKSWPPGRDTPDGCIPCQSSFRLAAAHCSIIWISALLVVVVSSGGDENNSGGGGCCGCSGGGRGGGLSSLSLR